MARAIDADELEMFPYSEGAGTEEQISEWIEQTGLSEDGTASRARDLCWKVIDGFINVVKTQPTLTQPNELERAGLYEKYTVLKNEDGSPVTNCFVLRPAEDPAAVAALRAYAAATDNAELANDIINWVGAEPNEPLMCEGCIHEHNEHENCNYCKRALYLGDYYYRRPPDGEEEI